MGASGAPMTPRRRRRSECRNEPLDPPGPADAMDGVRVRWPRTHCPNPSPLRPESSPTKSPAARRSASGPSMSGSSASPPGRRLPERGMSCSGMYCCCCCSCRICFSEGGGALRRRGISILAGDELLAGVFPRDLAGDSPRTTSSLSAEKNPCFLSFSIAELSKLRLTQSKKLAPANERRQKEDKQRDLSACLLASRGGQHGRECAARSGVEEGGECVWGKCEATARGRRRLG